MLSNTVDSIQYLSSHQISDDASILGPKWRIEIDSFILGIDT